jgi:hypothetical protein
MKIRASFTGSAGGPPAPDAQRSNRRAADPAAAGVVLALGAQREHL